AGAARARLPADDADHRASVVHCRERTPGDRARRRTHRRKRQPRRTAAHVHVLPPAGADAARRSMNQETEWYRSGGAQPNFRAGARRGVRTWIRARLPEPDVRGKVMVLHSRRTFPKITPRGWRSEYHGLFSEFHSVLGALHYGDAYGAAAVRVQF